MIKENKIEKKERKKKSVDEKEGDFFIFALIFFLAIVFLRGLDSILIFLTKIEYQIKPQILVEAKFFILTTLPHKNKGPEPLDNVSSGPVTTNNQTLRVLSKAYFFFSIFGCLLHGSETRMNSLFICCAERLNPRSLTFMRSSYHPILITLTIEIIIVIAIVMRLKKLPCISLKKEMNPLDAHMSPRKIMENLKKLQKLI